MCRYGDFVQGFVRGFDWGLGRGFVLEDHPRGSMKPQEAPITGGSAGIPDSLDHKPAVTSGPEGLSCDRNRVSVHLKFLLLSLLSRVAPIVSSIPYVIWLADHRVHKMPASLVHARPDLRNCRQSHRLTPAGNQSASTLERVAASRAAKSHEIGWPILLPFRLDRATFDVSPGNGNTPEFHTRREPCPTNTWEKIVTTHNPAATDEAISLLQERGFTTAPNGRRFLHPHAEVVVIDAEAVCFEVHALTRDRAKITVWEARLTHAPHTVFAATITAAIG